MAEIGFQRPLICDMCTVNRNICWHCQECNSFLCDSCKILHSKVKMDKDHSFKDLTRSLNMDMGTISSSNSMTSGLKPPPCRKHKDNNCEIFCKTCEEFVCPLCLNLFHRNHELDGIKNVHKEYLNKLEEIKDKIENVILKKFEEEEKILEDFKTIHKLKFEEAERKIKAREEFLIGEIGKATKPLLSELQEWWEVTNSDICEQKTKCEDIRKDLQFSKQTAVQIRDSNDILKMLKTIKDVSNDIDQLNRVEIDYIQQSKEFINGSVPEGLDKMTGYFKTAFIPELCLRSKKKFTVIHTKKFPFHSIKKIVPISSDFFLIASPKSLCKVQVDMNATRICYTKHIVGIEDTTTVLSGKHLITFTNCSRIFRFVDQSHITPFIDKSPLLPIALCSAANNCFYASLVDRTIGHELNPETNRRRQVIKFSMDKEVLSVIEYGANENEKLFDFPWRITTNINEDICVVDLSTSALKGKIVTLDRNGTLKWIYSGLKSKLNSHEFLPSDIVTTFLGNIIVCDTRNSMLHIIGENGLCLGAQSTCDFGIQYPLSLAVTIEHNLMIGCGKGSNNQSMLHLVKVRGC